MKAKDKPRAVLFPKVGESFTVVKVEDVHDKACGRRVFVHVVSADDPKFRTVLEVVSH